MNDLQKTFRAVKNASWWMQDANCRNMDTELFFSTNNNYDPCVKEVCATCPVSDECLWYANETNSDHGMFGGLSPKQRQAWRKKNGVILGMSKSDWEGRFRNRLRTVPSEWRA